MGGITPANASGTLRGLSAGAARPGGLSNLSGARVAVKRPPPARVLESGVCRSVQGAQAPNNSDILSTVSACKGVWRGEATEVLELVHDHLSSQASGEVEVSWGKKGDKLNLVHGATRASAVAIPMGNGFTTVAFKRRGGCVQDYHDVFRKMMKALDPAMPH